MYLGGGLEYWRLLELLDEGSIRRTWVEREYIYLWNPDDTYAFCRGTPRGTSELHLGQLHPMQAVSVALGIELGWPDQGAH